MSLGRAAGGHQCQVFRHRHFFGAPLQVEVNLVGTVKSVFGGHFGIGDTAIDIKSVAVVVGSIYFGPKNGPVVRGLGLKALALVLIARLVLKAVS